VRVYGGLGHALHHVCFHSLMDWHDNLAVDDGLDLIDYVGVNGLLDDGVPLVDSPTHGRCCRFMDMLLNMMDHIMVHVPVDNGLYLHYPIISYVLFYNGSPHDSALRDGIGLNTAHSVVSLLLRKSPTVGHLRVLAVVMAESLPLALYIFLKTMSVFKVEKNR